MPRKLMFAAAAALMLAKTAQAQRPVITQDIEGQGRTAYEHTLFATCLPSGFATLDFKPVDAAKRLAITYLSVSTAPRNGSPVLAFLDFLGGQPITQNAELYFSPPQYIFPMTQVRPGQVTAREAIVMVLPQRPIGAKPHVFWGAAWTTRNVDRLSGQRALSNSSVTGRPL